MKLLKAKSMDIIANVSLNVYSFALLTNHLCFRHDKTLFIPI